MQKCSSLCSFTNNKTVKFLVGNTALICKQVSVAQGCAFSYFVWSLFALAFDHFGEEMNLFPETVK
jgi:hypothetical protein